MPEPESTAPAGGGLYRKLAEVMAEIERVEKRGRNTFHKYDYVTEADLVDAVRSKLAKRNVMVIPSLTGIDERPVTSDKGKQSTITTARMAFTFCDGDTGEMHKADWAGQGEDPADKGLSKAYTASLKYFLMKTFLIPTGDDPEGDEATDKRSAGGQSDVPATAPDVWWTDTKALMEQISATEGWLRATLGEIDGVFVPPQVTDWKRLITSLDQTQRAIFRLALEQKAAADTPIDVGASA